MSLQLAVRVEDDLVERLDAVVERLRKNPENVAMRMSRATLIRLLIVRGLERFEREEGLA